MESVDVLVVGGGPAGTLAARRASEAGLLTVLVEAEPELGNPVHTSGATAVQTMLDFGVPNKYYHKVSKIRFCGPRETVQFEYDYPVVSIIDVRGTYQHLGNEAQRAGARIMTAVRAIEPLMEGTFVRGCKLKTATSEVEIESKILIDASGYRATMSKAAGLHPGFTRLGVGAEFELVAPNCPQDEVVLIVGKRYAPSGYAWVFPWGHDRVRIGVGVLHADTRSDPKNHLEKLCDEIQVFGIDLAGHQIKEYHYGLIPGHGLARRLAGDGLMAVGDAAGVASLVVGEGIRLSMISGDMAGRTAVAAVSQRNYSSKVLEAYEKSFRSKYERNLVIGHILNRRMASWDDEEWDEKLAVMKMVPPNLLVAILQSQFPLLSMAYWASRKPSLWPRFLRYAAKGLWSYMRY